MSNSGNISPRISTRNTRRTEWSSSRRGGFTHGTDRISEQGEPTAGMDALETNPSAFLEPEQQLQGRPA